ncbi:MAG: beta propeller repeat protein [Ferrimicrobium sp.]
MHAVPVAIPAGSPVFLGGGSLGNGLLTFDPQVPNSLTPKSFVPPHSALLAGISRSGKLRPLLTVAQGDALTAHYPGSGGNYVTSASFLNSKTGWATLEIGTYAIGIVVKTANGGRSWARVKGTYSAGNGSSLIVTAVNANTAWLEITPAGENVSDYFYLITAAGKQVKPVCLCDGGPTLLGLINQDKAFGTAMPLGNYASPKTGVSFLTFSGTKSTSWTPATPLHYALAAGGFQGQPEAVGITMKPHTGISHVVVETYHKVKAHITITNIHDIPSAAFGTRGSILLGWVTEQGIAKIALFTQGQSKPYRTANLGSILPKHGASSAIGPEPVAVERAGSSFLVLSSESLHNFGVLNRAWIVFS